MQPRKGFGFGVIAVLGLLKLVSEDAQFVGGRRVRGSSRTGLAWAKI